MILFSAALSCPSAAIAEEAQHEKEQVDEVEIERQRPHHGLATDDRAVLHRIIHFLDALRVPRGEAGEDEHTPAAEITKSSPVLLRNMLTSTAMINPISPIIRNDPMGPPA